MTLGVRRATGNFTVQRYEISALKSFARTRLDKIMQDYCRDTCKIILHSRIIVVCLAMSMANPAIDATPLDCWDCWSVGTYLLNEHKFWLGNCALELAWGIFVSAASIFEAIERERDWPL